MTPDQPSSRQSSANTGLRAGAASPLERGPEITTPVAVEEDLSDAPLLRVVCAAIRHKDGTIIAGARHYDGIMRGVILSICTDVEEARADGWYSCEQGFLTNTGEFLTREQADPVAVRANQIREHRGRIPGRLHSEDLY